MLEGLHPRKPTHIMRCETDEGSARTVTDLLGELFDPAETAIASFETVDNGPWLLEAYFSRQPDEQAIKELIRPYVGKGIDNVVFLQIDEKDWIKTSLEGLKPVRAGKILVHGSHDRPHVKANDLSIEIEAALAFGTGHHGTTLGCLLAFTDAVKTKKPLHILDVGTGTGILSFAAAKLLKTHIIAGDIDPVAVAVAKENAYLNGIHSLISLYAAPGIRHHLANRPKHFDIVMANILAKPLRLLARDLTSVIHPNGTLILSGLLIRDIPGVLSAYRIFGWHLRKRYELEGWAALVLKKSNR